MIIVDIDSIADWKWYPYEVIDRTSSIDSDHRDF